MRNIDDHFVEAGVSESTGGFVERWKWSRPDVHVYTSLIQGLAASLRVSDALTMIRNICKVGVSPGEEVKMPLLFLILAIRKISEFISKRECYTT